jgi:hypothetical protein
VLNAPPSLLFGCAKLVDRHVLTSYLVDQIDTDRVSSVHDVAKERVDAVEIRVMVQVAIAADKLELKQARVSFIV